jgi:hypothetical protein
MPKKTTKQTTIGADPLGSAGPNGLAAVPAEAAAAADPRIPRGKETENLRALGYPPALAKACVDLFEYALGLRDGTVIWFAVAEAIDETWVRLEGIGYVGDGHGRKADWANFLRGFEVRVTDISWVADNPNAEVLDGADEEADRTDHSLEQRSK